MHSLIRFGLLVCALAVSASAQCFFSISPQSASFAAGGGNGQVTITASASNCSRTAASNVPWITISFGQTGTGNGSAGYTVQANNTAQQRSGTLTIAGQVFTVTQAAGSCQFQLTPGQASVPASGGSGAFDVNTACAWSPTTTANWVTIVSGGGTGSGTVQWTAAANTGTSSRTATISVGTASFTITQAAQTCAITLSPTGATVGPGGGNGNITVNAGTGCSWTAVSNAPWITLTSGTSDTGNGTIAYAVAANTESSLRVGSISVNGTGFLIQQTGSTCNIVLNPQRLRVGAGGGSGNFGVLANCAWTATSTASWLTITSGASGSGPGTVSFSINPNFDAIARGGIINVGNAQFVVDQDAAACEVYLSELELAVPSDGGGGSFPVSTLRDCTWRATPSADWVRITSGDSGTGEGTVVFTVLRNPTIQVRTATISVGTRVFTVRQAASACAVTFETRAIEVPAAGGSGSVPIAANCRWQAVKSADWIQITSPPEGSADATLTFSVSANPTAEERRGTITINGQAVTITQPGQRCALTLAANTASLPARGGSGAVNVTGGTACNWSAHSPREWLRVEWSSAGGSGVIRFSADANTTGAERSAEVPVAGQTFTVRQPAVVLRIAADGILHAASFRGGAVAPGQIVTIYGSGFGPSTLLTAQLTPDLRAITTTLSSTRVLFDGVASPMIYTSDGQISAVVPYGVAERPTTSVEVEYLGVRSNAVVVPVAPSAPAIFSTGATGRGQGAILNQNSSLNGAGSAADRGTVIQIYATGGGVTRPASVDGQLAAAPFPAQVLPVRVRIGGVDARVLYAGAAPGAVAGLMQVNAMVPADVVPGPEVPVVLVVGDIESPAGVTVAVR